MFTYFYNLENNLNIKSIIIIRMYNYIMSFLSKKYSSCSESYPYPFGKNFRRGYKNAWINNIRDYKP